MWSVFLLIGLGLGHLDWTINKLEHYQRNQWQIDPAELFRVYPAQHATERQAIPTVRLETPEQLSKMLEKDQQKLERERAKLFTHVDDLETDRDWWRQQTTATFDPPAEHHTLAGLGKHEPARSILPNLSQFKP